MADHQSKQPGLVKSLLFPAYTDAGANDNFQAPQEDAMSQSDATTMIQDNRTVSRPQEIDDAAPSEQDATVSRPLDDSLFTQTGIDTTDAAEKSQSDSKTISLPPKRTMAARSASTTTHAGTRPFPTTSPSVQNIDHSLDSSSVTGASSSAAASSVLGVNFLNESNKSAEEPTPIKDNRSANFDPSVFEPRLADLGSGRQDRSDTYSDVNSTASEMGTVIGAPRLEEVQAMAAYMEKSESLYESESGASDVLSPAKDVPELSLPTLEERRSEERPRARSERSTVFREKMDSVFRDKGGASTPPPPPEESPSSATAMVSAAIRRLGSGVGNIGHSKKSPSHLYSGPYSAPTTPRVPPSPRVEDHFRSSLSSQQHSTEQSSESYLLRSPGSAVHFQPDGSRRKYSLKLAPRFSRSGESSRTSENKTNLRHANSLSSPLRFARGCVSFDNTVENRQYTQPTSIPENEPTSPLTHFFKRKDAPQSQSPVKQSRSWDATSATSSMNREPRTPSGGYKSFAFGRSPGSSTRGRSVLSAFRPAPLTRVRHANGFSFNDSNPGEWYAAKSLNDISPAVANSKPKDTVALRTPQRIEIERDDALDILACLVERSVAFDQELAQSSQVETIEEVDESVSKEKDDASTDAPSKDRGASSDSEKMELTDSDRVSTFADIGVRDVKSPPPTRRRSGIDLLQANSFSSDLTDAIRMIRKISRDHDRNANSAEDQDSSLTGHSTRMKAVDELLRSHTYAAEMRRAAKSASTWLRSIDRLESSSDENDLEIPRKFGGEVPSQQPDESDNEDARRRDDGTENENFKHVDKMEIVALRAMLHSAELKAKEKEDMALRLNEELSQCRAEIGRLKTESRAEKIMFASQNRSILDNDDESTSSVDVSTSDGTGGRGLSDALDNTSPISKAGTDKDASIDASFVRSDVVLEKVAAETNDQWFAISEAKRESVLLKAALSQANATIRKLYESSRQDNTDEGHSDAPVISTDSTELNKLLDDYKEAVRKEMESKAIQMPLLDNVATENGTCNSTDEGDARMVHVRMLDSENFVTDWADLAPPLPPPPDHGLRSPIVAALLQHWTSDVSMQESLLSWMERIMNGASCETIPPLTISALDHQVRDGFAMHVLPLLLRRSDIHVDVKTRAHRRTSYDMSVTVTSPVRHQEARQPVPPSTDKAKKTQVMAFKSSHRNQSVLDDSMQVGVGTSTATYDVSDYLRTSNYAHSSDVGSDSVANSASTALVTNSSKRFAGESRSTTRGIGPGESATGRNADRNMSEMPGHLTKAMFGDDASTSSSTTGDSSQKSAHNAGLMGTLGGAFGGLLRRKPSEAEPHYGEGGFDGNDYITHEADAVPSFLRHAPPQSPSRSEGDGQPYHRVVSAPPGRIGVTFVDYRGHAMVSDVAPESPLSGWVFPSDILIAIDEVPVSGMRVRDIIKLLTSRKERQRALRVISSHAMNEFTLNTTTASEAGAPS